MGVILRASHCAWPIHHLSSGRPHGSAGDAGRALDTYRGHRWPPGSGSLQKEWAIPKVFFATAIILRSSCGSFSTNRSEINWEMFKTISAELYYHVKTLDLRASYSTTPGGRYCQRAQLSGAIHGKSDIHHVHSYPGFRAASKARTSSSATRKMRASCGLPPLLQQARGDNRICAISIHFQCRQSETEMGR